MKSTATSFSVLGLFGRWGGGGGAVAVACCDDRSSAAPSEFVHTWQIDDDSENYTVEGVIL